MVSNSLGCQQFAQQGFDHDRLANPFNIVVHEFISSAVDCWSSWKARDPCPFSSPSVAPNLSWFVFSCNVPLQHSIFSLIFMLLALAWWFNIFVGESVSGYHANSHTLLPLHQILSCTKQGNVWKFLKRGR
jgi:hypothetical protein